MSADRANTIGDSRIHVAALHRMVWEQAGEQYDPDALNHIEADPSFPSVLVDSCRISERRLETVGQDCGVLVLRDQRGRLRLVDVRPVEAS